MDRTHFETGLRWPDYLKTFSEPRKREEWENVILEARVAEEDIFLWSRRPLNVLVISEHWCGDCREAVPLLIKLTQFVPGIDLRIFVRDKNKDLMQTYSTDGKERIPAFVFFDRDFREIGRWIERPEGYSVWMNEWLRAWMGGRPITALNPGEKRQFKAAKKIVWRKRFRRETLNEWMKILSKAGR